MESLKGFRWNEKGSRLRAGVKMNQCWYVGRNAHTGRPGDNEGYLRKGS